MLRAGPVLFALVLVSACQGAPSAGLSRVGVPGHVNEHVSIASDGASFVALAWAASSVSAGTNIFAAVSRDGGVSFAPPVRVNLVEGQARINGEQPPRIVLRQTGGRDPAMIVLWTARQGGTTVLLHAESLDDGRRFAPARSLLPDDVAGNRGWASMAARDDGRMFAMWLDHRDAVSTRSQGGTHQHGARSPEESDARAQRSQLFVGTLDGTVAPTAIARGVCYCCKTALASGPDGRMYAAWRHVFSGSERDIAFTMSDDVAGPAFRQPVRVSDDGWQLDGCPENGPALAVDASRRIHVIWPTLVRGDDEALRLFHASSVDGLAFSARSPLPSQGSAFHPQLLATRDGTLIAAWDELIAGSRRVRVARAQASQDGGYAFSIVPGSDAMAGAYPALANAGTHVVLAWAEPVENGESRVAVRRIR